MIPKLTEFLMKCDESKQVAILCSLDWLNHFIDFFRADFQVILDRAQQKAAQEAIQEESKEKMIEEQKTSALTQVVSANQELSRSKRQYLDPNVNVLLKVMYKEQFPDIISTILRLKHSRKINDERCKQLVENINGRFLKTVIMILTDKDEFENIFKRLKKEYDDVQKYSGDKQEAIIQWYTELFKEFSEELIVQHQDIF